MLCFSFRKIYVWFGMECWAKVFCLAVECVVLVEPEVEKGLWSTFEYYVVTVSF